MNASKGSTRATSTTVDPDDAPELGDAFFRRADQFEGERLVRRGRPPVAVQRPTLNMRIDADVLAALKAHGKGWQTRVNEILRAAVGKAGK